MDSQKGVSNGWRIRRIGSTGYRKHEFGSIGDCVDRRIGGSDCGCSE